MNQRPTIDIIIPLYNEASSIKSLYSQLTDVIDSLPYTFTLIFVDDGSTDNSISLLLDLKRQDIRIHIIELVRNFGKEIALTAGLHASNGDAAITMDADLQHPPQYIPAFIDYWLSGSQVVVGTRKNSEKRSPIRSFGTKLFYFIINHVSKVKISPDIMDFRLIDREVVEHFNRFHERNRITRGLIDWLGYPQMLVPVEIPERSFGDSTYSTRMLIKLARDSLVSMSLLPLKIAGYLGIAIVILFGPLGVIVLLDQAFFGDNLKVSGAGSLGIFTAFLIGIVLINLGLVALYIANMHDQILGRPLFVAKKSRSKYVATRHETALNPEFVTDKPPVAPPPIQAAAQQAPSLVTSPLTTAPSYNADNQDQYTANTNNYDYAHPTLTHSLTEPHFSKIGLRSLHIIDINDHHRKRILWLSWKDQAHPLSGGAELLSTEIRERLIRDGHEVTLITSSFDGAQSEETINGVQIIRMGGRYTVHLRALLYIVRSKLQFEPDFVVDEVNTAPFFFSWYGNRPTVLFFHQLARNIWFYEVPKLFSGFGYLAESIYLHLLQNNRVITVSRSSRLDLMRFGFSKERISIISEGIRLTPVPDPTQIQKYSLPTLLSLGAVRNMKRTLEQIKAFELAKSAVPKLRLIIAGDISGAYGEKVHDYVKQSEYARDILVLGKVSEPEKQELMRRSHWLLVTSVKEGWCLVVTEAASQGTPAIVYDVDGLRDSVKSGITGFVVHPTPAALAETIVDVMQHLKQLDDVEPDSEDIFANAPLSYETTDSDPRPFSSKDFIRKKPAQLSQPTENQIHSMHTDYVQMQYNAWAFACTITFDQAYEDFKISIGLQ